MKNKLIWILIFEICLFTISCSKKKTQNFPNPMSEMAIAMRSMTDNLQEVKINLSESSPPKLNFSSFSSLKMTSENFNKPGFNHMANQLMELSDKFDSQPTIENYNNIVYMCQSCHNYLCPGPLERIKKLEYIVKESSK